ncbi:SCO2521 family protein [Streptomyces sp. NPDC047072]|uniref:SCO2521 family protein n=1 Tax=Streptomyces sp. NPDC047072 TaxID=3154809 RepID=UPI0033E7E9E4
MRATGESGTVTALAFGEVRTALLATSRTLAHEEAGRLMRLREGDWVRVSSRPRLHAVSPDFLTGVDCPLPSAGGARIRGVGTVTAHAVLTDGRILQTAARLAAPAAGIHERRPWGRYLAEPGVVQPFGRLSAADVAEGWLAGRGRRGDLALGAIAERLLAEVTRHPLLDRRPPFTSRPTRLRWAAVRAAGDEGPVVERFTVDEDGQRAVRLRLPEDTPWLEAERFSEDLALHDWLLTTLMSVIERSRAGATDGGVALWALRPAVDHLLHAWMPKAFVDPALAVLWDALERETGFTRQWESMVQRVRDQLALALVDLAGRPASWNGG